MLPARDTELIQIVDVTLEDAVRRSQKADGGSWLSCRPGCASCCRGVFRITTLDAARLRSGLENLRVHSPDRASAIEKRAESFVSVMHSRFPGDSTTGQLSEDENAWEAFSDLPETDVSCPVLDQTTGRCELYDSRPLTCRVFGPPVQNEHGLGLCELCYVGASEDEIFSGQMHLKHCSLERELNAALPKFETVIAWAVLPDREEVKGPVTRFVASRRHL